MSLVFSYKTGGLLSEPDTTHWNFFFCEKEYRGLEIKEKVVIRESKLENNIPLSNSCFPTS